MYRGAYKSLALPGRKQANVSVRMVRISFGALPCGGGDLMTARVSMLLKSRTSLTSFRVCFLPGRAKDLSSPRYMKEDRNCGLPFRIQTSYACIYVYNYYYYYYWGKAMANYPQELAQDAACQIHTGHMTGLWFLQTQPLRLNTNE